MRESSNTTIAKHVDMLCGEPGSKQAHRAKTAASGSTAIVRLRWRPRTEESRRTRVTAFAVVLQLPPIEPFN